jgi:hypothetical protein
MLYNETGTLLTTITVDPFYTFTAPDATAVAGTPAKYSGLEEAAQ